MSSVFFFFFFFFFFFGGGGGGGWGLEQATQRTSLRLLVRDRILCIFCFYIFVFVAIKLKFNPTTPTELKIYLNTRKLSTKHTTGNIENQNISTALKRSVKITQGDLNQFNRIPTSLSASKARCWSLFGAIYK